MRVTASTREEHYSMINDEALRGSVCQIDIATFRIMMRPELTAALRDCLKRGINIRILAGVSGYDGNPDGALPQHNHETGDSTIPTLAELMQSCKGLKGTLCARWHKASHAKLWVFRRSKAPIYSNASVIVTGRNFNMGNWADFSVLVREARPVKELMQAYHALYVSGETPRVSSFVASIPPSFDPEK